MTTNSRILQLCLRDVDLDLVRSSGPGGQNVNKVATAVQLRFDVRDSVHLTPEVKQRLLRKAGRRATPTGVIIIQASRYRTQAQNRSDAFRRFSDLLETSLVTPRKRLPTKVTAAARERRLRAKRIRGELKRTRSRDVE